MFESIEDDERVEDVKWKMCECEEKVKKRCRKRGKVKEWKRWKKREEGRVERVKRKESSLRRR